MSHIVRFCLHTPLARCLFIAALCIFGPTHMVHADPFMEEPDTDERAVTEALTPDAPGDDALRGYVLSKPKTARPPRKPSLQMMITFKTSSSQLTDTAQVALDKVARELQSEQLAKRPVQIPLQGDVNFFGDL
ncbi:OmpA domain protein (fragment) [Paraburkholderia ribeironis]|uniref:OmpA domain protein n=1 Tax=Paraburkholderia ribeironis TaxID=1247936 RepID=A0A1N7SQI4_9BURK